MPKANLRRWSGRIGKRVSKVVLPMLITLSVLTATLTCSVWNAAPAVGQSASVKKAQKVDSGEPDADGWYGRYIDHDGTAFTADGDRTVVPYDRTEYMKTRIGYGEIYAGLKDDTVYYCKMERTSGTMAGSTGHTSCSFVMRNVKTGVETSIYDTAGDNLDIESYRQGNKIYLTEETSITSGGSTASEYRESSTEIRARIMEYNLETEQMNRYGELALDPYSGIRFVQFFATGDGGYGYLENRLESTGPVNPTGSYSTINKQVNRICLFDKTGTKTDEKELAEETLSSTMLNGCGDEKSIISYDEKTGNLFFRGRGESSGGDLMIATIQGGKIYTTGRMDTYGSGVTVDIGVGCNNAGLLSDGHMILSREFWDYTVGKGGAETFVLDSSRLSYDKPEPRSTATPELGSGGPEPVVYAINSPRSIQSVTLKNREEATDFVMVTRGSEKDMGTEVSVRGIKADYCKSRDSILFNTGMYEITEVSAKDKKVIARYKTTHSVWTTMVCGSRLVCMEREGTSGATTEQFYFESMEMASPTSLSIVKGGESGTATPVVTLTAGESADYASAFPTAQKPVTTFKSSDPAVLSVTHDGKAAAWKEGTATITATRTDGGGTQSLKVTVKPRQSKTSTCRELKELNNVVTISNRANAMSFKQVDTYLVETDDGQLLRIGVVEVYAEDDTDHSGDVIRHDLHAWYYSEEGKLLDEKVIPTELPEFGGFFKGKDAFYIVCGQKCPEKTTDPTASEVIRVIKYDFNWNRLASCSFDRELTDTMIPFRSGCVKMVESEGYLFIHTTKQMARAVDGDNHQTDLILMIDEATMKGYNTPKKGNYGTPFVDGYLAESLTSKGHCFGEYIRVKGRTIYLSELRDANIPSSRGNIYHEIRIDAEDTNSTSTRYDAARAFRLHGALGNSNPTGMNVGGFELSAQGALSVGNVLRKGWPADSENITEERRDVYISYFDSTMSQARNRYLTNYDPETADVITWAPHLVRIDDRHFLMMWLETDWTPALEFGKRKIWTKFQLIDCEGNSIGPCVKKKAIPSDCEPLLRKDGRISWVTEGPDNAVLYTIDPYDLEGIRDDVHIRYYDAGGSDNPGSDSEDDDKGELICNLKNNAIYGMNKVVKIDGSYVFRIIKLNGSKIGKKKNWSYFSFKLRTYKKKLKVLKKKKGKYKKNKKKLNVLYIKNVKGKTLKVKFYIKA